jgi:signal transduction histidine kinase
MNQDRRAGDVRRVSECYVRRMRVKRPELATAVDAGFAVVGAGLTALATWAPSSLIGTTVTGPPALRAVLPLLVGGPLLLRRRAPLLMWIILWSGISLQVLITRQEPQGPELAFVLAAGSYALAAHASLRRALAGLVVAVPGLTIYVIAGHPKVPGAVNIRTLFGGQTLGAPWFLAGVIAAFWLAGVFVQARRQAAALAEHNRTLARQAEQAVAAERTRIARELHDIVAHHLSVVVLQAAGARASGQPADRALEKIEHSGRQALTEMRRLLGMLREPDEEADLTPQPGLAELPALADSVRAAGLPVLLAVDGDSAAVPEAVGVSAYRIVQEALTNVLKHAGSAHAEVTVGCADDVVTIDITDDGAGLHEALVPAGPALEGPARADGRGLAGMRERVVMFCGELSTGPRPGGGFAVRARLPLGDRSP